jgi:hypothetical protein
MPVIMLMRVDAIGFHHLLQLNEMTVAIPVAVVCRWFYRCLLVAIPDHREAPPESGDWILRLEVGDWLSPLQQLEDHRSGDDKLVLFPSG